MPNLPKLPRWAVNFAFGCRLSWPKTLVGLTYILLFCTANAPLSLRADDAKPATAAELATRIALPKPTPWPGLTQNAWGVTRQGTSLTVWEEAARAADVQDSRRHILFVGGLDGQLASVDRVRAAIDWLATSEAGKQQRQTTRFTAILCANPDGVVDGSGPMNGAGGRTDRGYPPAGPAYHSPTAPEAAYLWRWLGARAPDLVIEVRAGMKRRVTMLDQFALSRDSDSKQLAAWSDFRKRVGATADGVADDELIAALPRSVAGGVGTIPAMRIETPSDQVSLSLAAVFAALDAAQVKLESEARRQLRERAARTPLQVAEQLAQVYGHELPQVEYIPAMALVGRIRLGELTNNPSHLRDVERIVEPYFAGTRDSTPKSGSGQSGHLIFSVLAESAAPERRARYRELARVAAGQMFEPDGTMRDAMPFHLEMSDALFMGAPILAATGRLVGEAAESERAGKEASEKYFEGSVRHLRFMRKLVLRPDDIYRHSPLDETAWGRGNGFPALGLALTLSEWPEDDPRRAELLTMLRDHLRALLRHQDADGMWHQVIDHPESYRELSCTCMIGWSLTRALRRGWVDDDASRDAARRAWQAVRLRVAADGQLLDVCTGTGKQTSLRAYYDREALLGRDPRGGAMSLLFATEMATTEK